MKLTTLLIALMVARAAFAQTAPPATTDAPNTDKPAVKDKLSADELQVMAHYKTVNQMEIDLGKAASKQSKSEAVKSYGAMLVKDHSESNDKLMALAKQHEQTIPVAKPATAEQKEAMTTAKENATKLNKLRGADFDREYLRMMVADHERELANIDANIAKVTNPELADMLKTMKPVLQHHADHARELQKADAQARR